MQHELFWDALFWVSIFLSPLMLLASFVLTKDCRLRLRIIRTGLAVLLSLPLGIVAVFESIFWIFHHASAGVGVAALPVVLGWLAAMLLWVLGCVYALVMRIINRPQNSNGPAPNHPA